MSTPPSKKTKTQPGLGSGVGQRRVDTAEIERVREAGGQPGSDGTAGLTPARLRESVRREDDDAPESSRAIRTGSNRPAVAVDEVGDAAMKIARTRRESAPSVLASRAVIALAPIDNREAFVLALVDGRSPMSAIVDGSGMPAEEAKAILARLVRLGLITA